MSVPPRMQASTFPEPLYNEVPQSGSFASEPRVEESVAASVPPSAPDAALREHLTRLGDAYAVRFRPAEIESHRAAFAELSAQRLCRVLTRLTPDGRTEVTVCAFDFAGELSIICGMFAASELNIIDGDAFTQVDLPSAEDSGRRKAVPWFKRQAKRPAGPSLPTRKIVDVFRVAPIEPGAAIPDWHAWQQRLDWLLRCLLEGDPKTAREALIEPVCSVLRKFVPARVLLPVEIDLDNDSSPQDTIIRIRSADSPAFLFQLLTAFAMRGIYVRSMRIGTEHGKVHDVLRVTDRNLHKLDVDRVGEELRAATALVKQFTHLLPLSPNPQMALANFGLFLDDLLRRPDWPVELATLRRPQVLTALSKLMGVSEFLWEDFLRLQHGNLLPVVTHTERLAPRRSFDEMRDELWADLARADPPTFANQCDVLNLWKDREMFRIDMRHILGKAAGFREFSQEMSDMAEIAVAALFELVRDELQRVHGTPRLDDGSACSICLAALGKTGGREMGCASDVELMFLYQGEGKTDGPKPVGCAEFVAELVNTLTAKLQARREGIFEVDLRLRPFGDGGPRGVSVAAFLSYYGPGGPAPNLQRQALVKLRPIAGEPAFAAQVVALRDRVLYEGSPLDVPNVLHLRKRQSAELVPAGKTNIKFSPGGLVDIEYLVQVLQVKFGRDDDALRSPNTLTALESLTDAGIVDPVATEEFRRGYLFLRELIDALRIVRGNAKDLCLPPADSDEFAYLARRTGYPADRPDVIRRRFAEDIDSTMQSVARLTADVYAREFPAA